MIWQHTRTITVKIDDLTKNAEKLKKISLPSNFDLLYFSSFLLLPNLCETKYIALAASNWSVALGAKENKEIRKYKWYILSG